MHVMVQQRLLQATDASRFVAEAPRGIAPERARDRRWRETDPSATELRGQSNEPGRLLAEGADEFDAEPIGALLAHGCLSNLLYLASIDLGRT